MSGLPDPGRRAFLNGSLLTRRGRSGADPLVAAAAGVAGTVRLDRLRCLAWNGVLCMSCLRPCRPNALSLDHQRRPVVDAQRCNGCDACVPVCPAGALTVHPPAVPPAA